MKKGLVSLRQYSILFMLASLLWIVPSVNAQAVPPSTAPPTAVPPHTAPPAPPDITHYELANFDTFLDSHPEIAEQLRRNPALVDDRDYLNSHPELQAYLQEHPQVREALTQDPRAFMRDENRYDRQEAQTTDRELATFDAFLDKHPEIAEQLRKDPSLADNKQFLQNHPALQQFLQEHAGIREQLAENPRVFMREEDRFDHRDNDNDARWRELATFNSFLDKHPEISEQLRKDPSLADNQQFLHNHPALQQFLQEHGQIKAQLEQNPQLFMKEEDRFEQRDHEGKPEVAKFNGFLGEHPEIARQLSQDPSLAKNDEYLENHPELKEYLKANVTVQQQLAQNPQAFMDSTKQVGTTGTTTGKQMVDPTKPKQ
jgi:phage-related protein